MCSEVSGSNFSGPQSPFFARKVAEIVEAPNKFVVIWVPQSFFKALANLSLEAFRHSGSASRGVKANHWPEAAHYKLFRFGERLDLHNFAGLQHPCGLYVLVDETFDRKNQLILKWRL